MKSYVITIYRFGADEGSGKILGTFTDTCGGGERKFADLDELHRLVDAAVQRGAVRNEE